MKLFHTRALALVMAGLFASPAWAVDALRLTYDASGAPVTFERDNAGTVQVDGLPYPGLVLYRPQTGVVYYQHPDVPQWISVPPGVAEAVSVTTVKGPAWQNWPAGAGGQASYRYTLKAEGDDKLPECGPLYASPGAAQQAGLTVADIYRILAAVAWLNAGTAVSPCDRLVMSPARGAVTGLPLHFTGPNGEWQLTELARTGIAKIELPLSPEPVSEQTRLDILLRQFGPDERKNFITSYGNLPVAQQIHLVEEALNSAASI